MRERRDLKDKKRKGKGIPQQQRKTYMKPKLIEYGTVEKLTQNLPTGKTHDATAGYIRS